MSTPQTIRRPDSTGTTPSTTRQLLHFLNSGQLEKFKALCKGLTKLDLSSEAGQPLILNEVGAYTLALHLESDECHLTELKLGPMCGHEHKIFSAFRKNASVITLDLNEVVLLRYWEEPPKASRLNEKDYEKLADRLKENIPLQFVNGSLGSTIGCMEREVNGFFWNMMITPNITEAPLPPHFADYEAAVKEATGVKLIGDPTPDHFANEPVKTEVIAPDKPVPQSTTSAVKPSPPIPRKERPIVPPLNLHQLSPPPPYESDTDQSSEASTERVHVRDVLQIERQGGLDSWLSVRDRKLTLEAQKLNQSDAALPVKLIIDSKIDFLDVSDCTYGPRVVDTILNAVRHREGEQFDCLRLDPEQLTPEHWTRLENLIRDGRLNRFEIYSADEKNIARMNRLREIPNERSMAAIHEEVERIGLFKALRNLDGTLMLAPTTLTKKDAALLAKFIALGLEVLDLSACDCDKGFVGIILDAVKERFRSPDGMKPLSKLHLNATALTDDKWKRLKNVVREGRVVDLEIHIRTSSYAALVKQFKLMQIQDSRPPAIIEI